VRRAPVVVRKGAAQRRQRRVTLRLAQGERASGLAAWCAAAAQQARACSSCTTCSRMGHQRSFAYGSAFGPRADSASFR
jgi:hypothetical protein